MAIVYDDGATVRPFTRPADLPVGRAADRRSPLGHLVVAGVGDPDDLHRVHVAERDALYAAILAVVPTACSAGIIVAECRPATRAFPSLQPCDVPGQYTVTEEAK